MKFAVPSVFILSASMAMAEKVKYYSAADIPDVHGLQGATEVCQTEGLIIADLSEWCTYALANPGVKYGMAPAFSGDVVNYVDIEEACRITRLPTISPTQSPTSSPTAGPTQVPTKAPTRAPTEPPTTAPTPAPTPAPTDPPTNAPTPAPTKPPAPAPTRPGLVRTSASLAPRPGKVRRALGDQSINSILCMTPTPELHLAPGKEKASGSGDPHFKTWSGEKFDYHGECDLVLVDNPSFGDGKGLRIHIRTTRVKYFSYIERIAVQIGGDVLEFANDVDNFFINGEKVAKNQKHHKTMFAGYIVRRDPNAISVRLQEVGKAKIDLHARKNGFPAIILDAGSTDIFEGSLGLLGEWKTGRKLARDGTTEIAVVPEDAEEFAIEWQVRDTEPMLFNESRFPQFPNACLRPTKMTRVGMSKAKAEAEAACNHWEYDKDDCIFDVMATRDVLVAEEGHIIHID